MTSEVKTTDVRDKIEAAFKRSAEIDARRVNVPATDGKVILTGSGASGLGGTGCHAGRGSPGDRSVI